MSSAVEKTKLLIVDTAPAMAQVLKTYAEQNSYQADVFSDSQEACGALAQRFINPGAGSYDCMILGWPPGQTSIISDLLAELSSPDHSDLPIIVLSEEPDKDVQAFARRRRNTRTLLWSEYKRIEDLLEGIVISESPVDPAVTAEEATSNNLSAVNGVAPQKAVQSRARARVLPTSILLVDNETEVCNSLKRLLETNGYTVAITNTAADACNTLDKRRFDLVLTQFTPDEESSIDFWKYIQTINEDRRPVCATMTDGNLDSAVQQSLAVGAIACLDKSESIEILFARVHTIINKLEASNGEAFKPAIAASVKSNSTGTVNGNVASNSMGVSNLTEASVQSDSVPSIVIDERQNIIAANKEATAILSGGDRSLLINKNFEQAIHGAPFRLSPEQPVRGLFRNLDGKMFSVAYRSCSVAGSQYGRAGDVCMLTFESEDRKTASVTEQTVVESVEFVDMPEAPAIDPIVPTETRHAVAAPAVDIDLGAVTGLDDYTGSIDVAGQNDRSEAQASVEQDVIVPEIDTDSEQVTDSEQSVVTESVDSTEAVRVQIDRALKGRAQDHTYSLLMLDIKMIAPATGDCLSLSKSELMQEMVETALVDLCDSNVSIEYDGAGKFILLYESDQPGQSRSNAEKLVQQIPGLLKHLSKIELLSHASFVELPINENITANYILKHCAAACMKAQIDGMDNGLFDINASGKLKGVKPPRRESVATQARVSAPAQKREDQRIAQSA